MTRLGSGGAQGAPGANFSRFWVYFGVIWGPQIVILEPYWRLFWSIQQQIAAKMVIWASYWDIFCSKQQLIASNSSKQEQIVANSTKQRQVSSKKLQILVIISSSSAVAAGQISKNQANSTLKQQIGYKNQEIMQKAASSGKQQQTAVHSGQQQQAAANTGKC